MSILKIVQCFPRKCSGLKQVFQNVQNWLSFLTIIFFSATEIFAYKISILYPPSSLTMHGSKTIAESPWKAFGGDSIVFLPLPLFWKKRASVYFYTKPFFLHRAVSVRAFNVILVYSCSPHYPFLSGFFLNNGDTEDDSPRNNSQKFDIVHACNPNTWMTEAGRLRV